MPFFCSFLDPITYYRSRERDLPCPHFFSGTAAYYFNSSKHPPEFVHEYTFCESHRLRSHSTKAPAREVKYLAITRIFCAAGSQFPSTKTPRESFLAAYNYCLAHPTPSHTYLIRSMPKFRGLSLRVRSCSCPGSEVLTFGWGLFFCRIVSASNFETNFDYQSRCRPLLRKRGRPIWRESQAAVDETLS